MADRPRRVVFEAGSLNQTAKLNGVEPAAQLLLALRDADIQMVLSTNLASLNTMKTAGFSREMIGLFSCVSLDARWLVKRFSDMHSRLASPEERARDKDTRVVSSYSGHHLTSILPDKIHPGLWGAGVLINNSPDYQVWAQRGRFEWLSLNSLLRYDPSEAVDQLDCALHRASAHPLLLSFEHFLNDGGVNFAYKSPIQLQVEDLAAQAVLAD